MKCRFLLASLLVGTALPLSGFAQPENDFQIYAAMSKLEANAAEASGGLALFVLNNGNRAEYAEDYADDVTTFYGYLRAIEALEITPAPSSRRSSISSGTPGGRSRMRGRRSWQPCRAAAPRLS